MRSTTAALSAVTLLLLVGCAYNAANQPDASSITLVEVSSIQECIFDGMEFVWIPPYQQQMSATAALNRRGDWQASYATGSTAGFWITKYEITDRQFQVFSPGDNSGEFNCRPMDKNDQPALDVEWEKAEAFADWLSQTTGVRYRLPTARELRFAFRAGQSPRLHTLHCDATLDGAGWILRDTDLDTKSLESLNPDCVFLCDTSGAVRQWCINASDCDEAPIPDEMIAMATPIPKVNSTVASQPNTARNRDCWRLYDANAKLIWKGCATEMDCADAGHSSESILDKKTSAQAKRDCWRLIDSDGRIVVKGTCDDPSNCLDSDGGSDETPADSLPSGGERDCWRLYDAADNLIWKGCINYSDCLELPSESAGDGQKREKRDCWRLIDAEGKTIAKGCMHPSDCLRAGQPVGQLRKEASIKSERNCWRLFDAKGRLIWKACDTPDCMAKTADDDANFAPKETLNAGEPARGGRDCWRLIDADGKTVAKGCVDPSDCLYSGD
ncbi:MAG: SUMF1/EgtB/PvdO family nonheme iron enzyme, partial [Candidatus Coatesbacteria bacterium]|nr:SUMF1/EgtB/PvdO family nonheme iron enzyme [Candidatus Coatesbacteria bacterium]